MYKHTCINTCETYYVPYVDYIACSWAWMSIYGAKIKSNRDVFRRRLNVHKLLQLQISTGRLLKTESTINNT